MEVLLSIFLGDLTTRAMSFFISRSSSPQAPDVEEHLHRVLLRAQVINDEAMGRHITNQSMLLQLHKLRDVMHRCCYMLGTFGYESHEEEDIKGQLVRVRDRFSEIVFLSDRDFTNNKLATFREGCAWKHHQNPMLNSKKDGRLLIVIELVGNLSEDSWNRLYSSYKQYGPRGNKIILTSWSDKIVKFGTTGALTLKYLSHEVCWYLFKKLTFGSMDPETHPRLVHLAMEIARTLNGSLLGRMAQPSKDFAVLDEDAPKVMMRDVMYGRVKQPGNLRPWLGKTYDDSIQNSHDRVSQVTILLKPYYNIVICKVFGVNRIVPDFEA
ncbi:hypothetical protein EJB05_40797, partial [Eragrostis curvula]